MRVICLNGEVTGLVLHAVAAHAVLRRAFGCITLGRAQALKALLRRGQKCAAGVANRGKRRHRVAVWQVGKGGTAMHALHIVKKHDVPAVITVEKSHGLSLPYAQLRR